MVNKVILVGRLGRSPERRYSQSGKAVCTFTLATDAGFGDNKKTDWHSITTFDKTAEACAKYLHKGSMVYVEGRITYDAYEKDGIKRVATRIIASDVRFIDTRDTAPTGATQQCQASAPMAFVSPSAQTEYPTGSESDYFGDDVPF